MPPPSKISRLPSAIRLELDARLATSAFAGFHAHAAWLKGEGFAVGKSAIHAYAQRARPRIEADLKGLGRLAAAREAQHEWESNLSEAAAEGLHGAAKAIDQRIECLRIASALQTPGAGVGDLCDQAADLYRWATGA